MSTQENQGIELSTNDKLAALNEHAYTLGIELQPQETLSILGMLCAKPCFSDQDHMLRGDIVFARETIPPTREFVLQGLFRAVQKHVEAPKQARKLAESQEALQNLQLIN